MLSLQNIILSIGILIITLMINLFSLHLLKWKSSLGLTDIVNLIVAFLTFSAVYISYKAVTISAKSANLTKKQFDLTNAQYEREKKSNLLPIGDTYLKKPNQIFFNFDSPAFIDLEKGDFEIDLINVGLGNAYSLQAQIRLLNHYEYISQMPIDSPTIYNVLNDHSYQLIFKDDKLFVYDKPSLHEKDGNPLEVYVRDTVNHKSVIYSKEKISLQISSYLQIILIHHINYLLEIKREKEQVEGIMPEYIIPKFCISMKFKSEEELGTFEESEHTFEIKFDDIDITDLSGTIGFRLDYETIETPLD